jgi:hypothetical protein
MTRSRGVRFVLAAVLLGFALVASVSAQTPSPRPDPALASVFAGQSQSLPQTDMVPKPVQQCGPICFTAFHFTTPTISGSGSSCTAAQTSLNSQLTSIARGDCVNNEGFLGSCNVVIHNTTTCTMIGSGAWQIQGYATYNCKDTTC